MKNTVRAISVALKAADQLNETLAEYCLPGDSIPVSLENLTRAFKERYNIDVLVDKLKPKTGLIQGMVEIYDGRSIIRVAAGLPPH